MSAMKIQELIERIKENQYYWGGMELTSQQAAILAELSDDEYDALVATLLHEPIADYRPLHGEAYRKTYAHLVYGAFLFCMRPNPMLYPLVLAGTLGIADPSSIQYGVAALQQARPLEKVAADLLVIAEQHKNDMEILDRIGSIFYWLGLTEKGSHRVILALDEPWMILYQKRAEPETNWDEIAKILPKVKAFADAYRKRQEQQQANGYERRSVQPGEFDGWEDEQVWE